MEYPSSRDRVCENGPKRFGHGVKEKFQGIEFRNFYELASKVLEYEELLKE